MGCPARNLVTTLTELCRFTPKNADTSAKNCGNEFNEFIIY